MCQCCHHFWYNGGAMIQLHSLWIAWVRDQASLDKTVAAATWVETSMGLSVSLQFAGGQQQKRTGQMQLSSTRMWTVSWSIYPVETLWGMMTIRMVRVFGHADSSNVAWLTFYTARPPRSNSWSSQSPSSQSHMQPFKAIGLCWFSIPVWPVIDPIISLWGV